MTIPPAIACPFTAQTTGRGNEYQLAAIRLIPSIIAFSPSASSVGTILRSTPAEKNFSRPVSTTAPGPAAASSSAEARTSSISSASRAFAGGRSTRTRATSSCCSTCT